MVRDWAINKDVDAAQMKRWGHLKGDVNYQKVAEQVYLATECDKVSKGLGYSTHAKTMTTHVIMGKVFDPAKPDAYVKSFSIHSMA